MTRQSMTGFTSLDGERDLLSWQWEIRSVNGKGLDLRMRLADGFDGLEGSDVFYTIIYWASVVLLGYGSWQLHRAHD